MAVLAGIVVLLGVLWLLGNWGDEEDPGDEVGATPTPAATTAPGGDEGDGEQSEKRKRTPAKRTVVRLQIQPTGPVSVCLENAGGEPLIQNITLQANQDTEPFRSKRFKMSFGTGEAVMRVDGKAYPVSDDAPIGYEVRAGGKPKALPEAERPTCE
jgi:hypothetical protein